MDRNLKVGWVSNFLGDKKFFFPKNFFFSKVVGNSIIRLKTLWVMVAGKKFTKKNFGNKIFFWQLENATIILS